MAATLGTTTRCIAPGLAVVRSEYFVLALAAVYFAVLAPFTPGFTTTENLQNILTTLLPLFIVAVGQTVVLVTGGIDLSVTSIVALCSIGGAAVMNGDNGWLADHSIAVPAAISVMLGMGAAVGLVNGLAVTRFRMPAFIVTLTSMMFVSGLAIWLTRSRNIGNLPAGFSQIGGRLWIALPLVALVAGAVHLMLSRSLWGRWVYAVGHNSAAARISGVPVGGTVVSAYVLSGVLAAVAAVLYTGQAESASPVLAQKLLLDIVGATVIGGTSLFGGKGKSTLMNILGGNLQPSSGRMIFAGEPYAPRHPQEAARRGIAFIHQELNLFPNLTIAENLFLTSFPRSAGFLIDRGTARDNTARLLKQVGLELPPATLVERLSAGERQLVEIAKALSLGTRLVIFDEPTTSLSAPEAEALFALMARLRERGLSIIYISHSLPDVLRLCGHIVVLRDGAVVGCGRREEFTAERLIALMIGRNLEQLFPTRESQPAGEVVLEARGITQPGIVRGISFAVRRGELVGIGGLLGAGRSELARILFGLDPCARGEVLLNGRDIARLEPRRRIRQGLAFLTENRREEGLCLEAAIADNIALVSLRRHAGRALGLLDTARLRSAVAGIREAVRLTRTAADEAPVKTLSGGNQQKVVLAKWLMAQPDVLILDEPTRGIDVGAKFDLYQLLLQWADRGTAAVVISSELEELIGICDRILVMRRGEMVGEFRRPDFDRAEILAAALGTGRPRAEAAAEEATR